MARSIENFGASLIPMAGQEERTRLEAVIQHAQIITSDLSFLYGGIAPIAFGPGSTPPKEGHWK